MEQEEVTKTVLKYQPVGYMERLLIEQWFFTERRSQGYRRITKIPYNEWAVRLGRCVRTVRNEMARGACPHLDPKLFDYTAYSAKVAQDNADLNALNKGAPRRMDTDADYRRGIVMIVTLVRKKRFRKDVREDELRHSVYAAVHVVNAAIPEAKLKPRNIYCLIHCQDGSARAARRALRKFMKVAGEVLSITFDNGVEFSDIKGMELIIQGRYAEAIRVFFATPFRSCDRATNENNHRFIRRFVPKGTDLASVSAERIKMNIDFINNYPRKIFGGMSARQMFHLEKKGAA
jgi:IS30 family transposase